MVIRERVRAHGGRPTTDQRVWLVRVRVPCVVGLRQATRGVDITNRSARRCTCVAVCACGCARCGWGQVHFSVLTLTCHFTKLKS